MVSSEGTLKDEFQVSQKRCLPSGSTQKLAENIFHTTISTKSFEGEWG